MNKILSGIDHLVIGSPVLICGAVGVGFGFLEQSQNQIAKAVGFLGCRTAIILGVVSGLPVMIYSFAKTIFAKALNAGLGKQYKGLKDFAEQSEKQLNITLVAVAGYPIWILISPKIVRLLLVTYRTSQQIQAVIAAFFESEQYAQLKATYDQIQRLFPSGSRPTTTIVELTDEEAAALERQKQQRSSVEGVD